VRLFLPLILLVSVLDAGDPPAIAERTTYLADLAQAMTVQWPKNRAITIVCHGHSVPAGYFKTPVVDTFNAYPHLLHLELKQRAPHAVINIIVTAIGGENAESGAKRFADDVLSHRPDLITIDYALNDRGIGLERAKAAWSAMIVQAGERRIPLILLTPTPDQSAKLDDPQDPLNRHAEQIRQLAAEHHLALVDSLAAFKAAIAKGAPLPSLMSQVNHPNRQGHELVAAGLLEWFPAR
jgi:acyl-CoA thioesterase-1